MGCSGANNEQEAPPSLQALYISECDKGLLTLEGYLGPQKVRILIDSGATGCFINEGLARRGQLPLCKKKRPNKVKVASGAVVLSKRWVKNLAFSIGTYHDSVKAAEPQCQLED